MRTMRVERWLLSICIALMALAINGQEVNVAYAFISFGCAVGFCLISLSHVGHGRHKQPDISIWLSLMFVAYAMLSMAVSLALSGNSLSIITTLPLLLLPLTFVAFSALPLSTVDWDRIDTVKICTNAALLFCGILIAGSSAEFVRSVTTSARFTWTEFRAVNPLPILAAMLLVWKHGFRTFWRVDFLFLVVFIYATKYTNWLALLVMALPLKFIAVRFGKVWLSTILIVAIASAIILIAVFWMELASLYPSEFARIYEIRLAYEQMIDSPFIGRGFGASIEDATYDVKYSIHNLLAYIASFGGILGGALFIAMVVSYARLNSGRSEYLIIVYLIMTATAASFKLPSIQIYVGLAVASMTIANRRIAAPPEERGSQRLRMISP